MKEKLKTPFGFLIIKLNNNIVDYDYICSPRTYNGIGTNIYSINFDVINLKVGDIITFEIENQKLVYDDGDERCDTLILENNDLILGMTGYEPQYHEVERLDHCYELYDCYSGIFEYRIEREPGNYKNKFKDSHSIKMNVAWIKKEEFKDYATAIDLLTWL